ncbi:MAG: hypothetical protein INR65_03510 [Gluconacetobacter diazotrophicus]|nr:hypothetical protein [Gluconacetobacter diazotrophicus]
MPDSDNGHRRNGSGIVGALGGMLVAEDPARIGTGPDRYRFLDQTGAVVAGHLDDLPPAALRELHAALRDAIDAAASGRPGALHDWHDAVERMDRAAALELVRRVLAADGRPWTELANPPLAGDDRDLPRLRVRDDPGGLSVLLDGLVDLPLLMTDGKPARLLPGWRAVDLVTRLLPFLVIELEHDDGDHAAWIMDAWLRHADNDHLTSEVVWPRIREVVPPLMRAEWFRVFDGDFATPPDPIFRIHPRALLRIFRNTTSEVCPAIIERQLRDLPPELELPPPATGRRRHPVVLHREHVERALRHELFAAGIAAIRDRRFSWPSPVDGSDAPLEAVYPLNAYVILYQFRDRNGLGFIVPACDRDFVALGLFLPDANLLLGDLYHPEHFFRALIVGGVWHNLLQHVFMHHGIIAHSARDPGAPISNLFMGPPQLHIGHYVWNDLPGQLALVEQLGDRSPPSIVIGDEGTSELFGPLDELFPILRGRVDRGHPDALSFIPVAMRSGIVPIRFTRHYVSDSLRRIVRDRVGHTDIGRDIARRAREAFAGRPIIVVGIRLEDRTLDDNDGFLAAMLDHLRRRHPDAVVVFDGRNSRPGTGPGRTIHAISDHMLAVPAVEAELALVARLRARFHDTALEIESTINLPTEASLAWCYAARCCVAVWGAGMAKYRWLANLPTLSLTSHHNLTRRRDYDIYHNPAWMEDPAPMLHLRPEHVSDLAGRTGLVQEADRPGFEIFAVEHAGAFALLDQLLLVTQPRPPPNWIPRR